MTRPTIHLIFGLIAATLLALTLWQALTLRVNNELVQKVEIVPNKLLEHDPTQTDKLHPAIALKTASALSAGAEFGGAEAMLVKLSDQQKGSPIGLAAQFNLANHYLREGLRSDLPGAQTRPLLAIAKQRYRDLLLTNPGDWDARVNLENALRAAPEESKKLFDKRPPVKSVNVVVPDFTLKDLP